jgi:hypothetical protein
MAVMVNRPVQLPLGEATPGARAAQAGQPEAKAALVPAVQVATKDKAVDDA